MSAAAPDPAAEGAARALRAARARLVLGRDAASAFFATLALRLTPEADRDCPTMATDGGRLIYGPAFVTGLSPDELLGVLVHEVLHCALAHHARRGDRSPGRWNVACDLAVNPILLDAGFALPAGRLVPGVGAYAHLEPGRSAEEYCAALAETPPEQGGGEGGSGAGADPGSVEDPGGCGSVREPRASLNDDEGDWPEAVTLARLAAGGRGDLPAGLRRLADEVTARPVDWRAELRAFVGSFAKNDYSWMRPNRRYLARGWYLPGLHSEELGEVVIAVDTSGSVGDRELGAFAAEVRAILDSFDGAAVVLDHDTEIRSVREWRTADGPLGLDLTGGGGTSHVAVFEWLARREPAPACIVCLTDLETRFPEAVPAVPVLWAVLGDSALVPPFGRRIAVGP